MKSLLRRVATEPNALTGLVIAAYGVLVAFHVLALSAEQTGALAALGGAAVFALRWAVTPVAKQSEQRNILGKG